MVQFKLHNFKRLRDLLKSSTDLDLKRSVFFSSPYTIINFKSAGNSTQPSVSRVNGFSLCLPCFLIVCILSFISSICHLSNFPLITYHPVIWKSFQRPTVKLPKSIVCDWPSLVKSLGYYNSVLSMLGPLWHLEWFCWEWRVFCHYDLDITVENLYHYDLFIPGNLCLWKINLWTKK